MKTLDQEKNNQTSLIKPHLSSKNKSTKKSKLKQNVSDSNLTSRRHLKSANLSEGRPSDSSSSEQNMALSERKNKRKRQSSSSRRSSTTSSSSYSKRPRLDAGMLEDPGGGEQRGNGTRFSERRFAGEKLFMCNHCPLKFSILDNKDVHERTHKEKPYECVFCEMRISYKLGLRLQMKIHQ